MIWNKRNAWEKWMLGCGLLLLISCLDEVESAYQPGPTPAVTFLTADSTVVAETRYGQIYASGLRMDEGTSCFLIDFTYNALDTAAMTVGTKGYYTVRMKSQTAVAQSRLAEVVSDCTSLLPGELPVLEACATVPGLDTYFDYVRGFLFLPSVYEGPAGSAVQWRLEYDPQAAPSQAEGGTVYDLYLRLVASSSEESADSVSTEADLHAFDLSPLVRRIGENLDWKFQIHHISAINPDDSTQFQWTVSAPLSVKKRANLE
ncbi:MAG: hypothetical protein ACI30I_12270 [Parabacteroides sp.]